MQIYRPSTSLPIQGWSKHSGWLWIEIYQPKDTHIYFFIYWSPSWKEIISVITGCPQNTQSNTNATLAVPTSLSLQIWKLHLSWSMKLLGMLWFLYLKSHLLQNFTTSLTPGHKDYTFSELANVKHSIHIQAYHCSFFNLSPEFYFPGNNCIHSIQNTK